MKNKSVCLLSVLIGLLIIVRHLPAQSIQVSENKRYLVKDGKPFFYLGDTAWELFHRLSLEEAQKYLENRASKGFTVIQAVALAQLGGLSVPNANGDLPLVDKDPQQPVEAYFSHIDAVVDYATSLGLVVGMLPTWGSYWNTVNGDEKIFTSESAQFFGEYLGRRYRDKSIIWILGGDENINNDEERDIIEAMARGLRLGDRGMHLITYHPRGPGRSSDYFHTTEWLDFNMVQSSHAGHGLDNGMYIENDRKLNPPKPTMDGEPRYEMIPAGFYFAGANRLDLFTDDDCRQAAYWSLLAGACGFTYGHNSVWQMWDRDRNSVLGAVIPWHKALDHPGAFQMQHLRNLFESRPFNQLIADQSLILDGPQEGEGKIRAARADDESFLIFYSPRGEPFTVKKDTLSGIINREIWFDPRYGNSFVLHQSNTKGIQTYTPPTRGKGSDWILIIEDTGKNYPLPGVDH